DIGPSAAQLYYCHIIYHKVHFLSHRLAPKKQKSQMGSKVPNSMTDEASDQEINQLPPTTKELDAGALFVLKSQGTWLHCGYHLTTSIVAPALLSLPFALSLLGWTGGVLCLTLAAIVIFYSFNLLSLVLEHHAQLGNRQLRFRDMATHILGPKWGKYCVGPLQIGVCYGSVVASILLGGQSLKFIYLLYRPNGGMKLYHFISLFGGMTVLLAQMPSFHSLRHINLVSILLCLAYSTCATVASVHIGHSKMAPTRDYSLDGSPVDQLFGTFNGISIIATVYASLVIPEIQATIAPPVKGKMFKGLCLCFAIVITTYFSVAISGYWAFGNQAQGTILSNFMGSDGHIMLLPRWFLVMTNAFTLSQVSAVTLENWFADPKADQFAMRNVIPRLVSRTLAVISATFLAALLPFFGDIMALFGAFACIPLNFILPMVFYNITFKPSRNAAVLWIHRAIVAVSSILVAVGAVASVRQIVRDAKTYSLFANV
ncbi:GABA transporter 1, partial [Linum perenne]